MKICLTLGIKCTCIWYHKQENIDYITKKNMTSSLCKDCLFFRTKGTMWTYGQGTRNKKEKDKNMCVTYNYNEGFRGWRCVHPNDQTFKIENNKIDVDKINKCTKQIARETHFEIIMKFIWDACMLQIIGTSNVVAICGWK